MRDGTVTHQFCLFMSHLRKMFDFRAVLSNLLTAFLFSFVIYAVNPPHQLVPLVLQIFIYRSL